MIPRTIYGRGGEEFEEEDLVKNKDQALAQEGNYHDAAEIAGFPFRRCLITLLLAIVLVSALRAVQVNCTRKKVDIGIGLGGGFASKFQLMTRRAMSQLRRGCQVRVI
jgi:hypothetical protein